MGPCGATKSRRERAGGSTHTAETSLRRLRPKTQNRRLGRRPFLVDKISVVRGLSRTSLRFQQEGCNARSRSAAPAGRVVRQVIVHTERNTAKRTSASTWKIRVFVSLPRSRVAVFGPNCRRTM